MRHNIQSSITYIILHYITCDAVQIGCINNIVLMFSCLNSKVGTGVSYPDPPLYPCTKVTHTTVEVLLRLFIVFQSLYERVRDFQQIQWNIIGLHSLLCLLYLFCCLFRHICSHSRLYWTTLILFIQISTIFNSSATLRCIVSVKNVYVNQPPPPINHLIMIANDLTTNLDLGN